jgi:hypothetical protein
MEVSASPTVASSTPGRPSHTSASPSTSGRRSPATWTRSAARFIALFERYLGPDNWQSDLDTKAARALAGTLGRLRSTARQVLVAAFDARVARLGRERLGALVSGLRRCQTDAALEPADTATPPHDRYAPREMTPSASIRDPVGRFRRRARRLAWAGP